MGKTRKRNYDNFYRRRQGISTRSILLLLKAQSLPKRKCQTRYNYNLKIVKKNNLNRNSTREGIFMLETK